MLSQKAFRGGCHESSAKLFFLFAVARLDKSELLGKRPFVRVFYSRLLFSRWRCFVRDSGSFERTTFSSTSRHWLSASTLNRLLNPRCFGIDVLRYYQVALQASLSAPPVSHGLLIGSVTSLLARGCSDFAFGCRSMFTTQNGTHRKLSIRVVRRMVRL